MSYRNSTVVFVAIATLLALPAASADPGATSRCPPRCEVVLTPTTLVDPAAQAPELVAGGTAIVFLGPASRGEPNGLWSVPIDGATPPTLLAASTPGTAGVVGFVDADAAGHVVYLSEAAPGVFQLASVRVGEPASRRRLDPGLTAHTVDAFGGPHGGGVAVTPVGDVVFRMIPLDAGPSSLWVAPIDGARRAVRLSARLHAWDFVAAASGSAVVFRATDDSGRLGLYSAGLAPRQRAVRLVAPGAGGVDLDNHLPVVSADGEWVAFLADLEVAGRLDLMSARVGDGDSQRLIATGRALGEGGISLFHVAPMEETVVFGNDPDEPGATELFSSPLDASVAPTRMSVTAAAVAGSGAVGYFELVGQAQAVYMGNLEDVNRLEMYSATIGVTASQVTLSTVDLPSGADAWVGFPFASPDGARIAYVGLLTRATPELYTAPVDRPGGQVQISDVIADGVTADYFVFTPDGSHLVYSGSPISGDAGALLAAPADGTQPRVRLTPAVVPGGGIRLGPQGVRATPDSAWAVFTGDIVTDDVYELFAVPIDGSAEPIRLSRRTARAGTFTSIVATVECSVVFTHNRAKPHWLQLSVATIPGCTG